MMQCYLDLQKQSSQHGPSLSHDISMATQDKASVSSSSSPEIQELCNKVDTLMEAHNNRSRAPEKPHSDYRQRYSSQDTRQRNSACKEFPRRPLVCNYCNKNGHKWRKCRLRLAHAAAQYYPPMSSYQGQSFQGESMPNVHPNNYPPQFHGNQHFQ